MNRFQKQKLKEVKMLQKANPSWTIGKAKNVWRIMYNLNLNSPCENCDNSLCTKSYKGMLAYCNYQW